MLIVSNRASADLQPLSNSIIDRPIRNNDIASLTERRDDTGDGREGLGIHNAALRSKTRRDIGFRFHVDVLCPVKLRRTTGSNAICAECLDSLFLDLIIADKVIEVVGCEIGHCSTVGELDPGAGRAARVLANLIHAKV
jgi:hypothetical protein